MAAFHENTRSKTEQRDMMVVNVFTPPKKMMTWVEACLEEADSDDVVHIEKTEGLRSLDPPE